jgi:hypothetical protein
MEKKNTTEIYYYALIALVVLTLYIGHTTLRKKSSRESNNNNRQSTSYPQAYTVLGEDTLWHSHTPDTAYRQDWDSTGIPFIDTTAYPTRLYK